MQHPKISPARVASAQARKLSDYTALAIASNACRNNLQSLRKHAYPLTVSNRHVQLVNFHYNLLFALAQPLL